MNKGEMRENICNSVQKMDGHHLRCMYAFLEGMGKIQPKEPAPGEDIISTAIRTAPKIPEDYQLTAEEYRIIADAASDGYYLISYGFCLGFHRGQQALAEEHQGILEEMARIKSPEYLDLVKQFAHKLGENE